MSSCPKCSSIIIADQPCIACGFEATNTVEPEIAAPPVQIQHASAADTSDSNLFIMIAGVLLILVVAGFFALT